MSKMNRGKLATLLFIAFTFTFRIPIFYNAKTKDTFSPVDGTSAFISTILNTNNKEDNQQQKVSALARVLLYPSHVFPHLKESLKCRYNNNNSNSNNNKKLNHHHLYDDTSDQQCISYLPDFRSFVKKKEVLRTHKRLVKLFGEKTRTIYVVYIGSIFVTYSAAFAIITGTSGKVGVYGMALISMSVFSLSGRRDGAVPLPGLFVLSACAYTSMIFGNSRSSRRKSSRKVKKN
jgi:hypothetical protein